MPVDSRAGPILLAFSTCYCALSSGSGWAVSTEEEIYKAQRAEDRMSEFNAFAEEIALMKRADAGGAEAKQQLDDMAAEIHAMMRHKAM